MKLVKHKISRKSHIKIKLNDANLWTKFFEMLINKCIKDMKTRKIGIFAT
jgi:hypothetical protein